MRKTHRRPARTTIRAALYYRVSSDEQVEGYSLDAQARAAQAYCVAQGWEVVQEYRDEGKSARTDDVSKRPAFAAMLSDAEAGLFDVVVVHKLDRFARNIVVSMSSLEYLHDIGVAFVSICEQMDFTTPMGKATFGLLAVFAQYYSDNLSTETKKGKHERKRQGMYNGLLPFGVMKDEDGIPVTDPTTHPGLILAFTAGADGKSDREIANLLNEAGYRSTGNRGANPFRKDSVRRILINRFYLGELPDGEGAWIPGKHAAMIDAALFDAAQETRTVNERTRLTIARQAQTYSLSGVARCGHCGGRLHILTNKGSRARIYCYQRTQSEPCEQRSTFLEVYENQIADYLATFLIPADYHEQIMALYRQAQDTKQSNATRRRQIESRLERIKELYAWGDMERDAYQSERDALSGELATLTQDMDQSVILARTAAFLSDLPLAWNQATQEQRNRLARLMFDSVEIKDRRVTAVMPRPEFAPFFVLDCQARGENVIPCGSDGIRLRTIPSHSRRYGTSRCWLACHRSAVDTPNPALLCSLGCGRPSLRRTWVGPPFATSLTNSASPMRRSGRLCDGKTTPPSGTKRPGDSGHGVRRRHDVHSLRSIVAATSDARPLMFLNAVCAQEREILPPILWDGGEMLENADAPSRSDDTESDVWATRWRLCTTVSGV